MKSFTWSSDGSWVPLDSLEQTDSHRGSAVLERSHAAQTPPLIRAGCNELVRRWCASYLFLISIASRSRSLSFLSIARLLGHLWDTEYFIFVMTWPRYKLMKPFLFGLRTCCTDYCLFSLRLLSSNHLEVIHHLRYHLSHIVEIFHYSLFVLIRFCQIPSQFVTPSRSQSNLPCHSPSLPRNPQSPQ